jgi:hypothetical protein
MSEVGITVTEHNFGRGPSKDHSTSFVAIGSVVSEEKIFM